MGNNIVQDEPLIDMLKSIAPNIENVFNNKYKADMEAEQTERMRISSEMETAKLSNALAEKQMEYNKALTIQEHDNKFRAQKFFSLIALLSFLLFAGFVVVLFFIDKSLSEKMLNYFYEILKVLAGGVAGYWIAKSRFQTKEKKE